MDVVYHIIFTREAFKNSIPTTYTTLLGNIFSFRNNVKLIVIICIIYR